MSLTDAELDRLAQRHAKRRIGVMTGEDTVALIDAIPELLRLARIGLRTEAAPVVKVRGKVGTMPNFIRTNITTLGTGTVEFATIVVSHDMLGQRVRIVPDAAIDAAMEKP